MAPFAYFLTLATSLLLLGKANGQHLAIDPICHRGDTTDVACGGLHILEPLDSTAYSEISTSSPSSSVALHRRQTDIAFINYLIKYIKSAVFALEIIKANNASSRCQVGDDWVNQWNNLGLYGYYIKELV